MEEFKNLKRVALNEARKLDAAYANKDEFSEGDTKRYDCIMHGLKCQLTAEAMLGAEEYESEGGMSGRRGRGSDGRYVSRDMGNQSYTEGYDRGYSEAMNQMEHNEKGDRRSFADGYDRGYSEAMNRSGHYPVMPYYDNRRW